jgi:hypothetical protein
MNALGYVLIVLALRSVKAEDSITCNGVTHLPAGRYTVSNCTECTIVGEPGTIINFPPRGIGARNFCSGVLNLDGSLVLEGNPLMAQDDSCYSGPLIVNGNVEIKDCKNLFVSPLEINGGSSGQFLVSMTNSSVGGWSPIAISNNAKVKFTDCYLGVGEESLSIENSHVVFERVHAYSEYSGYSFKNSTVIASNTFFEGGHPQFVASDSVLNFTNSSVQFYTGNFVPGITLSRCALDVTCDSTNNGPHGNHVFSTDAGSWGSMGMDIIESQVHFERCSCHLDRAISVAGPLSIQKSSVTFGACSEFSGSSKAGESSPVIV